MEKNKTWTKYAESECITGKFNYYFRFENGKLKFKLERMDIMHSTEYDDIFYLCHQYKCEVILPLIVKILKSSWSQYYIAHYNWSTSGTQFWQMTGKYYWYRKCAEKALSRHEKFLQDKLLIMERLVVLKGEL